MKNKTLRGSLFGLLTRSYLLFTLVLLLITGVVFSLWNAWLGGLYRSVDWSALLSDPALASGDYAALGRYMGTQGNTFAVYDQAGELVYASAQDFDGHLTSGELSCVPFHNDPVVISAYDTVDKSGSPRRLLVQSTYTNDGTDPQVELMVLDEAGMVVFGGFGEQDSYTQREYDYLSGSRFPDAFLSRGTFTAANGQTMTVLLREKSITDADYYRRYAQSWRIWLLFLPLYLFSAGAFIWWLGRKIGRPLRRLNDAVEAQAEGRLSRVGNCGGTREIRRIGESFDRFSDRLAESEAERRRLDEGRQKLIADISHDLKTPITVINGYIDAICDGKVPPQETERYLKAIQAKAETLTELINAFHEYSKVEHPKFVLHPVRTDLGEFLRAYLAGKYDEIDLAGFTLEVSIPDRPVWCALDELQFRRVLDNLLSNALRHNRLGTVLFFDLTAGGGWATLRVADNGAGIPPERTRDIFEPFVVGSDARSGPGSGLGLSITRRIVEKHRGTIALSSSPAPGRSTEFVLQLPLDRQGK